MDRVVKFVFVLVFCGWCVACSETRDQGPAQCVPGAVQNCPCLDGTQGVQSCADDGFSYGECACATSPWPVDAQSEGGEGTQDLDGFTGAGKDVQEIEEDVVDTASPDTVSSPDSSQPEPEVVEPDEDTQETEPEEDGGVPTEDTVQPPDVEEGNGIKIVGCDGELTTLPEGYQDLRIEPASATLDVNDGEPNSLEFSIVVTTNDGVEEPEVADNWTYSLSGIASFDGNMLVAPGTGGGAGVVKAYWQGACVETPLTIHIRKVILLEEVPEDVDSFFPEDLVATDKGPEILYPLADAAFPNNISPMEIQWLNGQPAIEGWVRIGISGDFSTLSIFGSSAQFMELPNQFSWLMSEEAWESMWGLQGTPEREIQISWVPNPGVAVEIGGPEASMGEAVPIVLTDDEIGGAVYYWHNSTSGSGGAIRILDFEEAEPVTIPITDETGFQACHGCHTITPDGAGVAATFSGDLPLPDGTSGESWAMALFDTETGEHLDWVHPDAADFLNTPFTQFASFSLAWWTGLEKRMLVSQGGGLKPDEVDSPSQDLFSVDLLTGDVVQLTDQDGEGAVDVFPAFAPNGNFFVWTQSFVPGKLGVNTESQLMRMEYNGGAGGIGVPVEGASEPGELYYYPAITPDSEWIVFNKEGDVSPDVQVACKIGDGPIGESGSYNNCHSEVWIVPAEGGQAIRMDKANGPVGAGLTNSWPSVGPETPGDRHWIAFSSYRPYGHKLNSNEKPLAPIPVGGKADTIPQIWIVSIDPTKAEEGIDPSSAPVWLPNQDMTGGNHLGQWSARKDD